MTAELKFTILGCGSSGGVPRLGGNWGECDPSNPKNNRRRCSMLVQRITSAGSTNVLIDTSPDMRNQLLDANVGHLDAVVYTHAHADRTNGLDDLRQYVLIQGAQIPVYADPMTKDSLMFLNRLEKSYFTGSISYLDNLAPVDINFAMIQALITGNNIVVREDPETDKPEKYKVEIDNGNYLLSTLKRKKYDKTLKGKKTADATVNRIWLQPKTFKVTKSEITNFKSNKTIMASYDQFEEIGEQICGHLVEVVMQADQHVSMKLSYSKVILNKSLKMPFRIPSKYEPLK